MILINIILTPPPKLQIPIVDTSGKKLSRSSATIIRYFFLQNKTYLYEID